MTNQNVYQLSLTAMLVAIGILIPVISPVKITIEPMSFTLASHVAIMVAIFISGKIALATALGTTVGFLFAGFPLPVVLRAFTHVVWAYAAAWYISKHKGMGKSVKKMFFLNLGIALLHALLEMLITFMYFTNGSTADLVYMIFGLTGIGTIVHSSIDFLISFAVWKVLYKNSKIQKIANLQIS